MVKKTFAKPEHEIIRLEDSDIITTSGTDNLPTPSPSPSEDPGNSGGSSNLFGK